MMHNRSKFEKRLIFTGLTIIFLTLLLCNSAYSGSAYSALGFGLGNTGINARSAGMGSISIALPDSLSLDLQAPAAWGGIATVRFSLTGNISRVYSEDINGGSVDDHGRFNGAVMAVPFGRGIVFGVTLSPFTRMNYKWYAGDYETDAERLQGRGGFTQSLVGLSFPIKKNLNLGLALRGIFGKIEKHWQIDFEDPNELGASQTISDRYKGVGGSLSGSYLHKSGWSIGFNFNSNVEISVDRQEVVKQGYKTQYDSTVTLDTKYDLPVDFSIGIGKRFKRHSFGLETAFYNWDSAEEPASITGDFQNANRISVGWEWTPGYRAFDPRWRMFTYRAGVYLNDHYVKSGLQSETDSENYQPSYYGISAGIGVPYFNGLSRLDFGIEYGWMGDKQKHGVSEDFIIFTIGFNHSETWFVGQREKDR